MKNKIKMLVMDVDGTLTDGKIYIGSKGEIFKAFSVKDGLRIKEISKFGIMPVIITGRNSDIVAERAKELDITEIYQGVSDKSEVLKRVCENYGYDLSQVAYIGDDENDFECMQLCGIKGCPNDADDKIKKICGFVSKYRGGEGAVREFIDSIIDSL